MLFKRSCLKSFSLHQRYWIDIGYWYADYQYRYWGWKSLISVSLDQTICGPFNQCLKMAVWIYWAWRIEIKFFYVSIFHPRRQTVYKKWVKNVSAKLISSFHLCVMVLYHCHVTCLFSVGGLIYLTTAYLNHLIHHLITADSSFKLSRDPVLFFHLEFMRNPCVEAGLIPPLIQLLNSSDQEVLLQTGRALGNICYDSRK